ncbi:MAG: hypothetical protein S4CHLAM123_06210 [Chlamydiales bacterium]|nr:hypothetical protein [Chlamydiales bacterium]
MNNTKFKSKTEHLQQVQVLQAQLGQGHACYSLKDASSNALRNGAYKRGAQSLDCSSLNQVLEINTEQMWALVEPRITFQQLCRITLNLGFVPPVVPEFTTITVGGAIMGAALESSSHQFGQVSDTCIEYELLLGNGDKITASKEIHPDLFYALSGSYGTLGILTAVKIKLIAAKKWIDLSIRRYQDLGAMVKTLTQKCEEECIEGIVVHRQKGVIITGNQTDSPSYPIRRQKKYWSKWYVQQVDETNLANISMPLEEYLFRLDRAAFWMARYVHQFKTVFQLLLHLGIPKLKKGALHPNLLFRSLFGWALTSKKLYKFWHRVPNEISQNLFFIHDFYTPFAKAHAVLKRFIDQAEIFPIWLCPIRGTQTPQFLSPHYGKENFLNIGLYGVPKSALSIPELSAQFEQEILDAGGRKMLYSYTYYDKKTFEKEYAESAYQQLRKKFFAEKAFPSLYNKVTNKSRI